MRNQFKYDCVSGRRDIYDRIANAWIEDMIVYRLLLPIIAVVLTVIKSSHFFYLQRFLSINLKTTTKYKRFKARY